MRTIRALAVLPLLLAACGDDDAVDATDTDDPPGVDGEPGGGESGLFIEVAHVGGFIPPEFAFRDLPVVAVYADGTVFAPGAVPAIYPGPASAPVFTGAVDRAQIDELLALAADAGMIGAVPDVCDGGALPIADAASTRVTVVVDGDERVVEAYALDFSAADLGQTSLTDAELAARDALADLAAAASEAVLAAETPFEPERYRVLATAAGDVVDDVVPNELAWPEGLPPLVEGECVAIGGDDAATLAALLPTASSITRWLVGADAFTVAVRPVLPHEPDCSP